MIPDMSLRPLMILTLLLLAPPAAHADESSHWSYRPVASPAVPTPADATWPRNEIDRFVLRRLERENMLPRPAANRRTLVRRVSLDLRGLPPSVAEVREFVTDERPDAWDRLVDRFLDSPHHGERMAQDWLDLARFADTTGFAADLPRSNWLWRDWVIQAFNDNMPFDRFTVEQLAGDLLPAATVEQRIATGFHRNSMQMIGNNPVIEEARVKGVVDRVNTTGLVWLGTTIGCAECHEHKHDPISQKDFYRLFAIFNNTPHHGKAYGVHGPRARFLPRKLRKERADLRSRTTALRKKIADETASANFGRRLESWLSAAPVITPTSRSAHPGDHLPRGLSLDGKTAHVVEDAAFDITAGLTIAAWIRTTSVTADIVSKYDWRAGERSFLFGIGSEGEVKDRKAPPGHLFTWISSTSKTWSGIEVLSSTPINDGEWHHVAMTFDPGKRVDLFVDGRRLEDVERVGEAPPRIGSSHRALAIGGGYKQSPTPNAWFLDGDISDVRVLPFSVDSTDDLARHHPAVTTALRKPRGHRSEADLGRLRSLFAREDPACAAVLSEIAELESRDRALDAYLLTAQVMDELKEPRVTHVHVRGNYKIKGDRVEPGTPSALPPLSGLVNRLSFARWLVSAENPLTARVIVNRIWAQHFGVGIVATADDFGLRGSPPSHPELLDWLASRFVEEGWDLKKLHRRILRSATYRQTSRADHDQRSRDPTNTLLARGARFRLAAEQIRDSALAVSGLLDPRIGGPSVSPRTPPGWDQRLAQLDDRTWPKSDGADRYRRGLYTWWKRAALLPFFSTFDAPSREVCVVRRSQTNTPLQALTTLNDTVYLETARVLAERVLAETPDAARQARVRHAFEIVLSRWPTGPESDRVIAFVEAQRSFYLENPEAAEALANTGDAPREAGLDDATIAAWTMLGSVLLNLDEALSRS